MIQTVVSARNDPRNNADCTTSTKIVTATIRVEQPSNVARFLLTWGEMQNCMPSSPRRVDGTNLTKTVMLVTKGVPRSRKNITQLRSGTNTNTSTMMFQTESWDPSNNKKIGLIRKWDENTILTMIQIHPLGKR